MTIGKEVLKLAAFAGGILVNPTAHPKNGLIVADPTKSDQVSVFWNPAIHNHQAFELAVLANIRTEKDHEYAYASYPTISKTAPDGNGDWVTVRQLLNDDPFKAMRLAITNAAAQLGSRIIAIENGNEL